MLCTSLKMSNVPTAETPYALYGIQGTLCRKLLNNEFDLHDATKVWNDISLEDLWNDGDREQLSLYNYRLKC